MRILTVRQPWAWAIIHGGKDIENRVRNIAGAYRGPVAIHAAKTYNHEEWVRFGRANIGAYCRALDTRDSLTAAAIIGVVDLVDVHVARPAASGRLVDWAEHTKPGELCSPWAEWDAYHLVLANPRPLAEPIPYKGALGLRRLDDDTTARVLAQIGGA